MKNKVSCKETVSVDIKDLESLRAELDFFNEQCHCEDCDSGEYLSEAVETFLNKYATIVQQHTNESNKQ